MKTQTISAVLFDFDGTLVDSISGAYGAVCRMYRMEGLIPPTRDEWHEHFEPPWITSYQKFGLMWSKEKIWEMYLQFAEHIHRGAEFFSDVRPFLEHLTLRGVSIGVVSSQQERIIEERFHTHNLLGGVGYICGDAKDKATEILDYAVCTGVDPRTIAYIGDFGHDMRDAKRAGAFAIGLTRGNVSEYVFRKSGADLVVTHLSDLAGMSMFSA